MDTLLDLSGHTALITGASGGIGRVIARTLSGAGAQTVLHCSHDVKRLQSLSDEIGAVHMIACDLSQESRVKSMMESLAAKGVTPTLLVNNAGTGVTNLSSILDADEDHWQDINNVNLGGVYALTKYFAKGLMGADQSGAIVNIASIAALDPAQNHSHYAASKAALLMYTRASALELGAHNIRVNAVAPGFIHRADIETDWPEGVKSWQNRAPLGRLGTGEDVANAVLFLLSPAAVWISGNTLVVDGGMSTQNRW
jgi:NAD(P)-dependent dehydrogenase (short-subunit alcohol dehydrogenase family)